MEFYVTTCRMSRHVVTYDYRGIPSSICVSYGDVGFLDAITVL